VTAIAPATSTFLDLFKLTAGPAELKRLGEVLAAFAALPWENLSKYARKHGLLVPGAGEGARLVEAPSGWAPPPGFQKLRLADEVMLDHARLGTGGTCFSLTNALWRVVTDLGYRGYPVMADMRHGPNVHCALVVELDGLRYLLDPGYLVAEPVPLRRGVAVAVGHPGHRIEYRPVADLDEFELYTVDGSGAETFRYRLRAAPTDWPTFVGHWLASFDATGMNGLHLNRLTGEGRLSAHNLNLRVDTGHGKRNVKLRGVYVDEVAGRFGLAPDLVRRVYEEWERRRCRTT